MAYYLECDAINDYITASWVPASTFSLEVDIETTGAIDDNSAIIELYDAGGSERLGIRSQSGAWKIATAGKTPGTGTTITTNTRLTVRLDWDGTQFILYVDGVENYRVTPTSSSFLSSLDSLIFNKGELPITDSFGMKFYLATLVRDGVTAYKFDPSASNGTGSILPDTVGTNNGTLVNFPTDDSQWVFYSSGGTDALSADDIQSTSEVTSEILGQTHELTANDTESASQLSVPALTEQSSEDNLSANDVQSVSEVTQPAIGQVYNLAANDAESGSEVTPATIGQEHALTSVDISSLSEVSQPTLSEFTGATLSANDAQSLSEVASPVIEQVHVLKSNDIESRSEVYGFNSNWPYPIDPPAIPVRWTWGNRHPLTQSRVRLFRGNP